jgi:hypothetical protein
MARIDITTLAVIVLLTIALYVAYIILRGEGFTTASIAQPLPDDDKVSIDKAAAAAAALIASTAKDEATSSAQLVIDAQIEVDRLQVIANNAAAANRATAHLPVAAEVTKAGPKVSTAIAKRQTSIDKAGEYDRLAHKYLVSSELAYQNSRETTRTAIQQMQAKGVLKKQLEDDLKLAVENLTAKTNADRTRSFYASDLTSATQAKDRKQTEYTAAERLFNAAKTAAENANIKEESYSVAATDARQVSERALNLFNSAKQVPTIRPVVSSSSLTPPPPPSSSSSKPKIPPTRATTRPSISKPSSTTSSSNDTFLSSSAGAFIGGLFGSLLGNSLNSPQNGSEYLDDKYNNRKYSSSPNSKYMSGYKDSESEFSRGGVYSRQPSDYHGVSEYNDEDPYSIRRQGKNVDTCNLQSVNCGERRCSD